MAGTCPPAASSTHSTANTAARGLRTVRDTFTSPDAARQPENLFPLHRASAPPPRPTWSDLLPFTSRTLTPFSSRAVRTRPGAVREGPAGTRGNTLCDVGSIPGVDSGGILGDSSREANWGRSRCGSRFWLVRAWRAGTELDLGVLGGEGTAGAAAGAGRPTGRHGRDRERAVGAPPAAQRRQRGAPSRRCAAPAAGARTARTGDGPLAGTGRGRLPAAHRQRLPGPPALPANCGTRPGGPPRRGRPHAA